MHTIDNLVASGVEKQLTSSSVLHRLRCKTHAPNRIVGVRLWASYRESNPTLTAVIPILSADDLGKSALGLQ